MGLQRVRLDIGRLRAGAFWRILRGVMYHDQVKILTCAELTPCREIMGTVVAVGHRRASTIDLSGKILASYFKCEDAYKSPVVQFAHLPLE